MSGHVPIRSSAPLAVVLRHELLPDRHTWWRIADRTWRDPLDPGFAGRHGGRWNSPGSFATLYLNEELVTARLNLRAFIAQWPYEPEDLRDKTGPVLVGATLPRNQRVCDAHTRSGVHAARLPATYPFAKNGALVSHARCQQIGRQAKADGLQGVRTRSAQSRDGAGRELAWFPATVRSRTRRVETRAFDAWYWA